MCNDSTQGGLEYEPAISIYLLMYSSSMTHPDAEKKKHCKISVFLYNFI